MANTEKIYNLETFNSTDDDAKDREKIQKNEVPGVWFLIGKEKEVGKGNGAFICLQVAATKNIWGEIKIDKDYLTDEPPKDKWKKYVSQFGEELFEYPEGENNRREYLYHEIAEKYTDFEFIYIELGTSKEDRKTLEKYIGYKMRAKYWVNSRRSRVATDEGRQAELKIADDIVAVIEKVFGKETEKGAKLLKKIEEFIREKALYIEKVDEVDAVSPS